MSESKYPCVDVNGDFWVDRYTVLSRTICIFAVSIEPSKIEKTGSDLVLLTDVGVHRTFLIDEPDGRVWAVLVRAIVYWMRE